MKKRAMRGALFVCAAGLWVGCTDHEQREERQSLCPSCLAGGETGDFGGTPHPCSVVSSTVAIEHAGAQALGFDVGEIERRLAQPIDAPLRWTSQPLETGSAPSGYAPETRISATIELSSSWQHWRPDPAYCDGSICRRAEFDLELEQAGCPQTLGARVLVRIATADGALVAFAPGSVLVRKRASVDPAPDEPVYVDAAIDLREVSGSLLLAPDTTLGPHVGVLRISVRRTAEELEGDLTPSIVFPVYDERGSVVAIHARHEPLRATFPPRAAPSHGWTGSGGPIDAGVKREP